MWPVTDGQWPRGSRGQCGTDGCLSSEKWETRPEVPGVRPPEGRTTRAGSQRSQLSPYGALGLGGGLVELLRRQLVQLGVLEDKDRPDQ